MTALRHGGLTEFCPIDVPLLDSAARIRRLVERMADCLIRRDAFRNVSDAIKALNEANYPAFAVLRLAGDACVEAERTIVARAMA